MYIKNKIYALLFITLATLHISFAKAEPWFADPLFALPGQAEALGEGTFQLLNFYSTGNAIYDTDWQRVGVPSFAITQFTPDLTYGLAENVDVEFETDFVKNKNERKTDANLGDSALTLGYQILKQTDQNKYPDTRITLAEVIPTGRFDRLSTVNAGTDGTGLGSYQTTIGINTQYLLHINEEHFLNTHACFYYNIPSSVHIQGFSVFGGGTRTDGRISLGKSLTIDLAGEYSFNQNWVALLEGVFTYQHASTFKGFLGPTSNENRASRRGNLIRQTRIPSHLTPSRFNLGNAEIGSGNVDLFSLSPALEYNFTEKLSIIAGAWFSVTGKNTPEFVSTALALNIAW